MKDLFLKVSLSFSLLLFVASLGFRIYVFNTYSTTGQELKKFELEISQLDKENELLKQKISEQSSLNTIRSKALLLGMNEAPNLEFLSPVSSAAVVLVDDTSRF